MTVKKTKQKECREFTQLMNKFPGLCVLVVFKYDWLENSWSGRAGRWTFTLWGKFGDLLGGGVWAWPGRGSLPAAARRTSSSCCWICCWMRTSSPSSPCWGTAQWERGGVSCQSTWSHDAGGGIAYRRRRESGGKSSPHAEDSFNTISLVFVYDFFSPSLFFYRM